MNPPTPYPAFARSKSKSQNESRGTAFREITSRANTISKSAQDPFIGIKMETEQTGKGASKAPVATRRYSVASKFAAPKADNVNIVSSALQSKPKLNKRASFQGVISEPPFCSLTQSRSTLGKSTVVPSSKNSSKITTVSSSQGNFPGSLHRRQSLASGQHKKPHKPCTDLFKKSAPGCGKADSTQPQINQAKAMLLRTACYWLEHVKLAEILEEYGVSIGLFRLAVECGAEPIELLREELIAFIERYSIWSSTIQQVLLCYGVTTKDQESLASRLAVSGLQQSSPCTLETPHNCNFSADKELANQVRQKQMKSLEKDLNSAMEKDSAGATTREEIQIPDDEPVLFLPGQIENMDAESITREVISYIMSSMNDSDSCSNYNSDKCLQPKHDLLTNSSEQTDYLANAADVTANCAVSIPESISDPNSEFQEEATSGESLPSLNVWNTMPEGIPTCIPSGQEVALVPNNVTNDSTSTSRVSGEGTCISMELVDNSSDDLQSGNPAHLFSEESNFNAIKATVEVHGNVLENQDATRTSDDAMSSGETYVALPQNSIHKKKLNKVSGKVQTSETSTSRDSRSKSASGKSKVELSAFQTSSSELEIQGNRRMSHGFNGRRQNIKERSALISDITTTDSPASTDRAAASATPRSRCTSLSTPRSSTTAHALNLDTISRTRRKARLLKLAEEGNESHRMQLTNPLAELDKTVALPSHDRRVEDGDGFKQVCVCTVDGMQTCTTNDTDLMATPGSAGVRRSARLIKSAGVFTPSSVSTPRMQGHLETPKKA